MFMAYGDFDKENDNDVNSRDLKRPRLRLSTAKVLMKTRKSQTPNDQSAVWSDRQAKVYNEWLNYVFSKDRASYDDRCESNEASGLRGMLHRASAGAVHRRALLLYQDVFLSTAQTIESEISIGKLQIREDRDVLVDLGT
jgi:hypothetical protein